MSESIAVGVAESTGDGPGTPDVYVQPPGAVDPDGAAADSWATVDHEATTAHDPYHHPVEGGPLEAGFDDGAEDAFHAADDLPDQPQPSERDAGDLELARSFTLLPDGDTADLPGQGNPDDPRRHGHEPNRDDTEELPAGLVDPREDDRSGRGLSAATPALIAVVTVVAACAIWFGFVKAGLWRADVVGGDAASERDPIPAEWTVVGGPPGQEDAANPEDGVLPASGEFNEASVAGSAGDGTSDEARAETASPIANGRLLVRSVPAGTSVSVNGEPRGITPLAVSDLPYGDYDLRFTLEGLQPAERLVSISSDDPIVAINVQLGLTGDPPTGPLAVGSIYVDTRPPGAEVWLDQQLVGETPTVIPNVASGLHEVEFRLDGRGDWTTTVQVNPAEQTRVTGSLSEARQ